MAYLHYLIALVVGLGVASIALAQTTEPVIEQGEKRLQAGVAAQDTVDQLFDETQSMLTQYQSTLESVESLEVYNRLLQAQLDNQAKELASVEQTILNAAVIERQIAPLLLKMIESLELFVEADMPFLLQERRKRVAGLRDLLVRSDVSAAEKCRRVFEAYRIENDFGRTLEAYTAQIQLDGQAWDAEILRVGRVALMFALIGQEQSGYWDAQAQVWQTDNTATFRRFVQQGLKVANKETAPDLINIPLALTQAQP